MTSFSRSTAGFSTLVVLVTLLTACGGGDGGGNGTTDPPTTGAVQVSVTADGAARSGVTVGLYQGSSSTAAATGQTNASGSVAFQGRDPGAHAVEVVVPEGLVLADGETARKSLVVTAGQTTSTSFALESDAGTNVVEVLLNDDLTFTPANLTISPGTTVRWRSVSGMLHTVTPNGHAEWSEATLGASGETFTHTFDGTGTFPYYCSPHRAAGMTGSITVQ